MLDFALHANQLAAAFVFPPLPAHAQLSVFHPPLAGITAAAVITVFAVHRAVVFELERRRSARKACSRKAFALDEGRCLFGRRHHASRPALGRHEFRKEAKSMTSRQYLTPGFLQIQHQIIRQHAPKRRAKPVRSSSIADLL